MYVLFSAIFSRLEYINETDLTDTKTQNNNEWNVI